LVGSLLNKRPVHVNSAEFILDDSDLFAWCWKVDLKFDGD
jgi:hypothetical protein